MIRKTLTALVLASVTFSGGVALAQPAAAETARFSKYYATKASCAADLAVLRNSGWVIRTACVGAEYEVAKFQFRLTATR